MIWALNEPVKLLIRLWILLFHQLVGCLMNMVFIFVSAHQAFAVSLTASSIIGWIGTDGYNKLPVVCFAFSMPRGWGWGGGGGGRWAWGMKRKRYLTENHWRSAPSPACLPVLRPAALTSAAQHWAPPHEWITSANFPSTVATFSPFLLSLFSSLPAPILSITSKTFSLTPLHSFQCLFL